MGNEQVLARGPSRCRSHSNRLASELTTWTQVVDRNPIGGRIGSFEGFVSLLIATSVDKRPMCRLTTRLGPNFVSADTPPCFRPDSGIWSIRMADFARTQTRLTGLHC